ncbi:type II secretion system minor pseudopilin GspK [Vibrio algarum]|uniref:Type II secretion system protein K n=1 Tax=Vibrio algarum TaxID=3020714 RepID=A0ABT4YMP2_9VIBR|nr:type II secretion system minor pseudopilin GspK [Vibrio sp. KJ40-1]MDB1122496.1 type II secretion system minor pseudopilin GspK [Vibrio sp. KJ40-1]
MINKPSRRKAKKSAGAALIVVLLILAVMVSIAATMTERLFVNYTRVESRISHQQAFWYSIGIEALAKYGIQQSYEDGDTINMSQPWALKEQVFPLDYGVASGKIVDKQACFNINALGKEKQQANSTSKPYLVSVWQAILEELEVENYQAEVIADSTWEFLDSDTTSTTDYGVEDSTYEALLPAYITPNGMIADSTELRAVHQMNAVVMEKIRPVVCALPWDDWRLNVNTVDENGAVILVAMFSPALSLGDATALIENRPYDGWASVEDFLAERQIATIVATTRDKAEGFLTIDSQYFELDAQVIVNESRVRIRSLLFSKDRKDVSVIRRRFGGVIERVSDGSTE